MTESLKKTSAPLQIEVDEAAEVFQDLKQKLADVQKELSEARQQVADKEADLIRLVKDFGGPHATKSKILHGIVWEMVATFSQHTVQDSTAVERFRVALVDAKQTRLMKKIFKADTRWTMLSGAAEIVKSGKLSPSLMSLMLQCAVTQDKKPSLDVRPKKKAAA